MSHCSKYDNMQIVTISEFIMFHFIHYSFLILNVKQNNIEVKVVHLHKMQVKGNTPVSK